MRIGFFLVEAKRWPWHHREATGQKYGWGRTAGFGRFGGGWHWELGIRIGRHSILVSLLLGAIRLSWNKPKYEWEEYGHPDLFRSEPLVAWGGSVVVARLRPGEWFGWFEDDNEESIIPYDRTFPSADRAGFDAEHRAKRVLREERRKNRQEKVDA